MASLFEEVKQLPSLFEQKDIVAVKYEDSDVLILSYSHLEKMDDICKNVKQNFQGFPGCNMVLDHTQKVLTSIRSTKSLAEIQHFYSTKLIEVVDGLSMGIEVHYKLKVVQEDKWGFSLSSNVTSFGDMFSKKNARVIVGYKYTANVVTIPPSQVPDTEKVKSIQL